MLELWLGTVQSRFFSPTRSPPRRGGYNKKDSSVVETPSWGGEGDDRGEFTAFPRGILQVKIDRSRLPVFNFLGLRRRSTAGLGKWAKLTNEAFFIYINLLITSNCFPLSVVLFCLFVCLLL